MQPDKLLRDDSTLSDQVFVMDGNCGTISEDLLHLAERSDRMEAVIILSTVTPTKFELSLVSWMSRRQSSRITRQGR